MKFAKELERDAVPEWRIKYLNYKAGKKYVKAVSRAINRTPRTGPREHDSRIPGSGPRYLQRSSSVYDAVSQSQQGSGRTNVQSRSIPRPQEEDALTRDLDRMQYGSFVATPPLASPALDKSDTNDFELPAPALRLQQSQEAVETPKERGNPRRSVSMAALPAGNGSTSTPDFARPLAKISTQGTPRDPPPGLRRLMSHVGGFGTYRSGLGSRESRLDLGLEPFDLVRERETEFYDFMESELSKVESFYKMKEEQAGQRLNILREQLHEMRNRRIQEVADLQYHAHIDHNQNGEGQGKRDQPVWNPLKAKLFGPGPNTKALSAMARTPHLDGRRGGDASRDYIRRPEDHDVSYRTAKRKLKLALQEFYRGLELLKSYALLNRTAFRKLNKKFDKAANARPPYRFMNERVNKAWFVNSDALDGHIKAVEDLYARYFERGNHKLAVGKLRSLSKKPGNEGGSSFQNGLMIGIGGVFAVQGLIDGAQLLFHDDHELRVRTSYLMQIYGGYFLMLMLFSWFCINCWIWTANKVNYPFIFEFDPRHHLDWRRLAVFPSFFLLLFGIFIWINFNQYGAPELYLYYPVILIGITVAIIFLPVPLVGHKSRSWLAYSHWRLLLAGLYPVEFRDFFLGDMYCSLTYALANVELFFCLYANHWENPVQCNSNHSRLLGFFTALPPIWRFLQCIRRYKDTRNVFPHLVNCGKYSMSITAAVMLSLYRINGTRTHLALFITFSTINAIYCSIWDIFMDFSLLQTQSRHRGLRDILALKQRWPYYAIMVVDPILRFSWIFYGIFTHNTQHSTVVSFFVSFMEVARRGMWALFRVENEHCANVSQYKASRDVPLPYRIEPLMAQASANSSPTLESQAGESSQAAGGEEGPSATSTALGPTTSNTVRRREAAHIGRSFSKMLAEAHKQDFEKKRKPDTQAEEEEGAVDGQSDDEDEDEDEFEVNEASHLRHRDEPM
ncbi:hypothetical protein NLU13_9439 [Sarocladium strictum]|uniref:Uncharacterized protein n=1 Tax=Sarocladium strictum TaxID=5046 RepID=A0AA39GA41_SARSR|nr:hypothetical protein NLU13_9439 [Sarocladium strictum]